MSNQHRFRDHGETVYDFRDEFLVTCPRCSMCAYVFPLPDQEQLVPATAKIVCHTCGLNNVQPVHASVIHNTAHDWYFHLPLWLQTPCCGHILWARNRAQLAFLEQYVGAHLREEVPDSNQSLVSRLPRWLKSAKNRADVLRGIERLKQKAITV
jgi:hypothetical protein